MRKKTYLVTGGNGYIGSHMVKLLVEQGHHVHWVDNFSSGPRSFIHSYGKRHKLDISHPKMKGLLQKIHPDCLIHFAAKANVPEGEALPLTYYKENVSKTIMLLDYCIHSKVRNLIFSSTAAVYGVPKENTLEETHPRDPINTYGNTKFLMERIMQDLALKKMINIACLRYFNVVGCDPEGGLGENHQPETHLVPKMILSYLKNYENKKNKDIFEVFGNQYPTRDGTCLRDYVHVMDLANGHFQALKYLEDHPGFHIFNLGSEKGYTVKEVITALENVTKEKLKVKMAAARKGDVPILVANSQKAKEILGFSCKYSLEDAILHTLNFEKNRKQRKNKR